jgi:hypothetical protein
MTAAVLDATGHPLSVTAVEEILTVTLERGVRIRRAAIREGNTGLVRETDEGLLALDATHPAAYRLREEIRRLAAPTLLPKLRIRRWIEAREERERAIAAAEREREVDAALLRRGILHCLPDPEGPAVFGLLLPAEREIHTVTADKASELAELVRGLDVVAGLSVRETVEAIGPKPDRFVLRDLGPPQRTKRMPRGGPTIRLTPSLLITGSTGIEHPLGDPALARADAAAGRHDALRERVEDDLKSLFALYRFGVLHRRLLVRWEESLDLLDVDWAEPGDVPYRLQVRAAAAGTRPLEAVVGRAPEWDDPWREARRVRPKAVGPGGAEIYDWETGEFIYPIYVQAIRLL